MGALSATPTKARRMVETRMVDDVLVCVCVMVRVTSTGSSVRTLDRNYPVMNVDEDCSGLGCTESGNGEKRTLIARRSVYRMWCSTNLLPTNNTSRI